MLNYDNKEYLIVNLPFENDLNDTCTNNIWKKYGDLIIKDCSSFTDINNNKLFDNALYLNGSSSLSTDIELGEKDFTISFWVCPTEDKTDYNYIFIIPGIINNDYSIIPLLLMEYKNSNFILRSFKSDDTFFTATISLNTWNHISLCYNNNESKIYIYLNGKSIQTSHNYSIPKNINRQIFIGSSTHPLELYFTGYIKNFQIYNNILLSEENINELINKK